MQLVNAASQFHDSCAQLISTEVLSSAEVLCINQMQKLQKCLVAEELSCKSKGCIKKNLFSNMFVSTQFLNESSQKILVAQVLKVPNQINCDFLALFVWRLCTYEHATEEVFFIHPLLSASLMLQKCFMLSAQLCAQLMLQKCLVSSK